MMGVHMGALRRPPPFHPQAPIKGDISNMLESTFTALKCM